MNHKRGKPKNARAGCLLCKPWKGNGMHYDTHRDELAKESLQQDLRDCDLMGQSESVPDDRDDGGVTVVEVGSYNRPGRSRRLKRHEQTIECKNCGRVLNSYNFGPYCNQCREAENKAEVAKLYNFAMERTRQK